MRLTGLVAEGYRSLKSIRLEFGQVGLFVGENGVGKSNLYRALQLIKAAGQVPPLAVRSLAYPSSQ